MVRLGEQVEAAHGSHVDQELNTGRLTPQVAGLLVYFHT
jgi:hypothetical protein